MAAQAKRFDLVTKKMREVIEELALAGKDDLHDATSGSLTKKDLRGWHPYARRSRTSGQLALGMGRVTQAKKNKKQFGVKDNGSSQVTRSGAVNPYPVNKWTGGVQGGIFLVSRGKNIFDLGSSAPQAKFLFSPRGTKFMKPRLVMGDRTKHGNDGMLRVRFRARAQGYVNVVRAVGRTP